jgi:hypothetical protein
VFGGDVGLRGHGLDGLLAKMSECGNGSVEKNFGSIENYYIFDSYRCLFDRHYKHISSM